MIPCNDKKAEYMPVHGTGSAYYTLRMITLVIGLCLLFLIPHTAKAAYGVACDEQPQPVPPDDFTCDGFPAFSVNHCSVKVGGVNKKGQDWYVYTTDGHNTSGSLTGPTPPGAFMSSQENAGYTCWELAARYFKFRWNIDLHKLPSILAEALCLPDTCPGTGMPDSVVTPLNMSRHKADGSYIPVPGDLIAYCHGHIAVVNKVDKAAKTIDTVNENHGKVDPTPAISRGHPIAIGNDGTYIHANNNPNTPDSCAPAACTATGAPASPSGGAGGGEKLCKDKKTNAPIYCTTCDAQPQPIGFYEGYPTFTGNFCSGTPSTYSTDGFNTFANVADAAKAAPGQKAYATDIGGGGYQCMELADRYFHFKYGIDLTGNPTDYCDAKAPASGDWIKVDPNGNVAPGDLMIYRAGSCGMSASAGHVAIVTAINGDGTFTTLNQNWGGDNKLNDGVDHNAKKSCACTFLHATKNVNTNSTCSINFRQEAYALAVFNTGIGAVLGRSGHVEAFARNLFGFIWTSYHVPISYGPPGLRVFQWPAEWHMFVPTFVFNAGSDPIVARDANGCPDVFYITGGVADLIGAGGDIWHIREGHHTWPLTNNGCEPTLEYPIIPLPYSFPRPVNMNHPASAISNVSWAIINDRIHLFYRDARDKSIWTIEQRAKGGETWNAPVSLKVGTNSVANLTVITVGNTVHIFYPGTNTATTPSSKPPKPPKNGGPILDEKTLYIWHTYGNGGKWSKPVSLGDVITSNVAATVNNDGRMEIFYRGSTEELRHMWQLSRGANAPWNLPAPPAKILVYDPALGEKMTSDPAVIKNQNGTIQVFYRGSEGDVWSLWKVGEGIAHNGIWAKHMDISNAITASPVTLARDSAGRIEVFFLGPIALNTTLKVVQHLMAPTLIGLILKALDEAAKFTDLAWNIQENSPNSYNAWSKLKWIPGLVNRDPNMVGAGGAQTCGGGGGGGCGAPASGMIDSATVKAMEGFEGKINGCYNDGFGNNTFGVGHLVIPNEKLPAGCSPLCSLSGDQLKQCVESVWCDDIKKYSDEIWKQVQAAGLAGKVTQGQFNALVDLGFNLGTHSSVISELLNRIKSGNLDPASIASLIEQYDHANGQVVQGLLTRRKADANQFLNCKWTPL